jgi:hypothetical protein
MIINQYSNFLIIDENNNFYQIIKKAPVAAATIMAAISNLHLLRAQKACFFILVA